MPVIEVLTDIHAPAELCFDLARDIDLHIESTAGTGERAVGGVLNGLISLGEEVTWEATHFGIRQRLTSRITQFDRPRHFRDSQVRGAFRRFDHDHSFRVESDTTLMRDVFDYESPLGLLGKLVDFCLLRSYMARLLRKRALVIKAAAETSTLKRL
ncbi:MAG TPA: SRPBCC family protein [Bryobacteraceae bacterium]|jgi:ligand-binding SRPBCC domain-containing protein